EALVQQGLLVLVDLAHGEDPIDAVAVKLNFGCEERDPLVLHDGALDVGRLHDPPRAILGMEHRVHEPGAGESHGEGGGPLAVLGLHDLVAAELDAVRQRVSGLLCIAPETAGDGGRGVGQGRENWVRLRRDKTGVPSWRKLPGVVRAPTNRGVGNSGGRGRGERTLRKERDDGRAAVAADNGDTRPEGGGVRLVDEARRAHDVKGGDAEETARVVDAALLEHFGADRHGGVDGVRDDEQLRFRAVPGDGVGEAGDNPGVGVEQVVARHPGLARHARWHDHDLGALERLA
ncbi:MAG: LOW QUALITY PROTEIN: hypothetical protein BJ554DRAFT_4647, partial [Olpidium bornovanus]